MSKVFKFVGFIGITLILFLVVATLAFYHLIQVGEFRRFLISEIESRTQMQAQLGAANLEIGWITGIVFDGLTLSEPGALKPAITAERIVARVALVPLLRRQIVIYEIRVQKPTASFVRDKDGRIALLDKLLNLPFLKQQDSEFSLDLRSLTIAGGDIALTDRLHKPGLDAWRLVDASLNLDRLRGRRLREVMERLRQRPVAMAQGPVLTFQIKGLALHGNAKINVDARGRLAFPGKSLEFHRARWDGEVEMVQIPAALLKEYLDGSLPIRSLTGYLGQRVHIEGSPETSLRLKGDLEFRGLRLEAPEFFAAPIGGADGHMTFDFDWRPERVQIKRADVRANGINFSLRGDIAALDSRDPRIRLTLSGLSVPAPALRTYLPLKILNSAGLEKTVKAIQTGQVEIKQAAIDATLGELRHLAENHARPLRMEAELRDIAVALPERGALPLHIVDGRIQWANGVLSAINLRAEYGDSRFSDIDGSCDFSTAGCGTFDVTAKGDINLGELKEQIHREWFPLPFAKVAPSVQELGGRAKIDLVLQRSPKSPMRFEGKAVLGNARLRYDRYALSDIRGTLSLTPTKISGEKIHALLGGSPIEVQISLADYDAPNGSFDLVIESSGVKAGLVASLLLDTGSPQDPGTVRGSVHYWGPLSHDERKFTGDLDLVNVQLLVHPLLQPLRELNGQIRIDEAGIDFQNLRALLVGVPASLSGRWRYTSSPQLLFDFAAPNLDITYLISQIDPESSEFYANLVAEGKITLGKGRIKDFDFSNLRTSASIDHRVWRLTGLTARSAGGTIQGVTTIFDRPETLAVVAEPKIQNVPIQSFLNWFSATTTEMTGKVELTGRLETVGISDAERKRNLSGAFKLRVKEGTINRMRIVVQILNLLDLSRWFTFQLPDLAKQGIRFRSITGNFTVNHGVFSTENLFVDSDDLRMTGIGKIDLPKDELDFIVAVRPFAGIDSAINQIPILGRGIAAIKNSFLVASFNIRGKIDNPTITPAPLGTLSEMFWSVLGIPKNIISSGEGQKKGQPQTGGKPGASP